MSIIRSILNSRIFSRPYTSKCHPATSMCVYVGWTSPAPVHTTLHRHHQHQPTPNRYMSELAKPPTKKEKEAAKLAKANTKAIAS